MTDEKMHLNLFTMNSVEHVTAGLWRHPDDQSHRYEDLDYWVDVAETAERGGFEAIFFADVRGVYDVYGGDRDVAVSKAIQTPSSDPQSLVSAMAAATDDVGFAVTRSTTYTHPYQLARELSSLDHLTDGRLAFNVVTSFLESAARNLGLGETQMTREQRYGRADEFMEVCYALWEDSWEDDAVLIDRERGIYTDPKKVHRIDHEGERFSVPGPHGCEPSPQRTPVIFQAGSSDRGRRFAANNAEAVFVSQPTEAAVAEYVSDLRGRVSEAGRDPADVRFFPGIVPVVGETDAEARAKFEEYREYVDVEATLALLSGFVDMDLSELEPDQRVERVETEAIQGVVNAFTKGLPDRDVTVREMAEYAGIGTTSPVVVGSPETVADELEYWFEEVDVDGFNVKEVVRPGTLEDFVDLVVPELRRRNLLREEYDSPVLRERLTGSRRIDETHPARR